MTRFFGGGVTSPYRGYVLTVLDGDPDDVAAAGTSYQTIGSQLEWTAGELAKLSSDEKYTAQGLDAIRESAGELAGQLRNISSRYCSTGPVLVTYAEALRRARTTTVDPLVDQIRRAQVEHERAQESLTRALTRADDLDRTWPWEDDPTPSERTAVADAVSDAQSDESSARSSLDELWASFESGYSEWEEAYDAAVSGVQDACETSGIDDTWWEDLLDETAVWATIIGTALLIAAIVITAPFAGLLLAAATVMSLVALAAHVTMMACGSVRVSMADILFDVVGVVPFLGAFGKGAAVGKGFAGSLRGALGLEGASRATIAAARNSIAYDLRSIAGAGGHFGGQAGRAARAAGVANRFVVDVASRWGRNIWNALRYGGTHLDGQAATMAERIVSAWPGGRPGHAALRWVRDLGNPGPLTQGLNVWNAGYGVWQSVESFDHSLPEMPDFVPTPSR